jgi:hypothetical protein
MAQAHTWPRNEVTNKTAMGNPQPLLGTDHVVCGWVEVAVSSVEAKRNAQKITLWQHEESKQCG